MLARLPCWMSFVALSLILALSNGCGGKTVGRSRLSTKLPTREVKVSVDGPAWITSQENTAIVTFGNRKLVVEKTRVLLDDKDVATLAEDAALVEVDSTAGTLTVTADGTIVATVTPSK